MNWRHFALVGIGANLPGPDGAAPFATCRWAVGELERLPGLRLAGLSRWWDSAPIPPDPGSPWYVNGVALLEGQADPAELLARLHAIEARAGRLRPAVNAPRSLDLDLIDLDGLVRDAPDPVLPHPRAHERGFVLHPLAEIVPGWRHPRLGCGVDALIAALPPQHLAPRADGPGAMRPAAPD